MSPNQGNSLALGDHALLVPQLQAIIEQTPKSRISANVALTSGWKSFEIRHADYRIRFEQDPIGAVDPFSASDHHLWIGEQKIPLRSEIVAGLIAALEQKWPGQSAA